MAILLLVRLGEIAARDALGVQPVHGLVGAAPDEGRQRLPVEAVAFRAGFAVAVLELARAAQAQGPGSASHSDR